MTGFTNSPHLEKGGIVALNPNTIATND